MQGLLGRLALRDQNVEVVGALHVAVLVDARKVSIRHTELIALVDVGRTAQQVHKERKHPGRLDAQRAVVAESRHHTRLVVVVPKERVPAAARLHTLLPRGKKTLQLPQVSRHELPLLAILIVDLEMVEREDHRELMVGRAGVAQAGVEGRGRHLAHGEHPVDARLAHQLLQVLVDMRPVGVEAPAVALVVVLEDLGLGDKVHHVEAEGVHALLAPKAHDVGGLAANLRVRPVEVGLARVEEMQVPLTHARRPLPGRAAELGRPIGRKLIGRAAAEEVVVLVALLAGKGTLEPLVLGRGVVQHHVEHDADAAPLGLAGKLLEVGHGSVARVDCAVIGHIVAVVLLRRGEERGEPNVIDAQLRQVVELLRDAAQVPPAVAVGVLEALGIDLVDDLVGNIDGLHHSTSQ